MSLLQKVQLHQPLTKVCPPTPCHTHTSPSAASILLPHSATASTCAPVEAEAEEIKACKPTAQFLQKMPVNADSKHFKIKFLIL